MADQTDSAFLEFFKHTGGGLNAAEFFKRPRPNEKEIPESETFDYIVVGAGPAGSVVAGKIAEANPSASVLVLEAGESHTDNPTLKNPRLWLQQQEDPKYSWGYWSTCQEGLYGRRVPLLRSRCLGGGTSLSWMRGGKGTFDEWITRHGCEGWGWNEVLPYFKELEKEIGVSSAEPPPHPSGKEWSEALIAAGKATSMHFTSFADDTGTHHGVGYNQLMLREGKVQNMFEVFVRRKGLPNVTVRCNTFVTHVLMSHGGSGSSACSAYGVHCRPANNPCGPFTAVRARREVILTAGAIATPLILMRSGIGNRKTLRECGIEPLIDLPGVGHNLTDDLCVGVTYATEKELPSEAEAMAASNVVMRPQNFPATITAVSCAIPGLWNMPESWKRGFLLVAFCHSLKSRGHVKMDPNNLEGPPIIEMSYLANKKDVKQAAKAVLQLRAIGQSESLKPWKAKEVCPTEHIGSKEALEAYVRGMAFGSMYPAGTCRMGAILSGDTSISPPVVDPATLKVFGCERLRVMDSSVLPSNPQAIPAATVLVVALKGAHMMIKEHGSRL